MTRRDLWRGALGAAALTGCGRTAGAQAGKRVVSLDFSLTETLLALGREPVAIVDAEYWDRWIVDPPLPASVQNLGSDQQLNFELLVSLKPDLILTSPYLDPLVPTLERIAPCERFAIYEPGREGPLAHAEAAMLRLATVLGLQSRAATYLADARDGFVADRDRLAGLPRVPLLVVNFMDDRHVRVYGAKSLWQDVFGRLGWPNAWTQATNAWGFATVGIEELAAVPPDTLLVAMKPIPADTLATLDGSPLWQNLPFVRAKRSITLPPALVFGAVPSARRFSRLLTDGLRTASLG